MRDGEENLNETFSVLLLHMPAQKDSYRKKQAITKCGLYWHGWEKRKRLITVHWTKLTDYVKKHGKTQRTILRIITWFSPPWATRTLPTAISKVRMKAKRAAGGLVHHLTPLSSRKQTQTEQTMKKSAQCRAGLSTVIDHEHMADHTLSITSEPTFIFHST